jgi:hypothetical protein
MMAAMRAAILASAMTLLVTSLTACSSDGPAASPVTHAPTLSNGLVVNVPPASEQSDLTVKDYPQALDSLTFTLVLGRPNDGRIPSKIRVRNISGDTVTDPGCRVASNYSWGVVPVAKPWATLSRRVMTRCSGSNDLPDGFTHTYKGPTFSLTKGPRGESSTLGPGSYLATIDFGEARTHRLSAKLFITDPL